MSILLHHKIVFEAEPEPHGFFRGRGRNLLASRHPKKTEYHAKEQDKTRQTFFLHAPSPSQCNIPKSDISLGIFRYFTTPFLPFQGANKRKRSTRPGKSPKTALRLYFRMFD
ncbi:MAG: hypothetical protein SOV43_05265 [Selenomonadaceae bacterium]|nr:hypothetical protein [Selenomonadaceae bacterium]MDY2685563.1 hypothetical protein [Selenomonadaceae bacterium]